MEDKSKLLEMLREIRDKGTPEQFQRAQEMYQNKFGNPAMTQGRAFFDSRIGGEPIIKDVTEKFDTKGVKNIISGSEFVDKIANLRALKKFGKALPGIGTLVGLGSALSSGDASAAIPILDEAEDLGPDKNSLEGQFERGEINAQRFGELKKALGQDSIAREGEESQTSKDSLGLESSEDTSMVDSARRQGELMGRVPNSTTKEQEKPDKKKFNNLLNQLRGQ